MFNDIRFFAVAAALALTGAFGEAAEGITATLAPTKGAYYAGEPIELQLTVTNDQSHEVLLAARYPTFQLHSRGIRLSLGPPAEAAGQTVQVGYKRSFDPNGRTPIKPIAPGGTWQVRVYMMRFPSDFTPGTYDVSYTLDLAVGPSVSELASTTAGSGKFRIVVLYPSEDQIAAVLADYWKRLDIQNYWEGRAATEAFANCWSPLAVPYVAKAVDQGQGWIDLQALAKFRGDAEAEALVLATIRGRKGDPLWALSVLDEWGYALDSADFDTLMGRSDDLSLRLAALRYAAKVGRKDYLPTIAKFTGNSDPTVAEQAKRVEALLSGR